MLVCNVSLRPARAGSAAIVADIVEAITAVDATASGQVVFATLVDDPASVADIVDAYLGEIMLEAASASEEFSAGSGFAVAVDEALTATETQDATLGVPLVARSAMLPDVFVNSNGTLREANVDGIMVNL